MFRNKATIWIFLAIVALGVVIMLLLSSYAGVLGPDTNKVDSGESETLAQKKAEILSQVRGQNRVLTKEEKDALRSKLAGKAFMEYQFTYEEEITIIETLNR